MAVSLAEPPRVHGILAVTDREEKGIASTRWWSAEWTDGGSLRHARFIDLRTDKRVADVVREG